MSIFLGSSQLSSLYFGASSISKVYLGTSEIFSAGSSGGETSAWTTLQNLVRARKRFFNLCTR